MSWIRYNGKILKENGRIAVDTSCCCGCCPSMPYCFNAEIENSCGVFPFTMCSRVGGHYGRVFLNCRPDAYTPCGDTTSYEIEVLLHTYSVPEVSPCVLTFSCLKNGTFGDGCVTLPSGTCGPPLNLSAGVCLVPASACGPCRITGSGGMLVWRGFV